MQLIGEAKKFDATWWQNFVSLEVEVDPAYIHFIIA